MSRKLLNIEVRIYVGEKNMEEHEIMGYEKLR